MKKTSWLGLAIIGFACSVGAILVLNVGWVGAQASPTAIVSVNGAAVTTAPCGSVYTFAVSNYSGPSVWLDQTKNGSSSYSGVYPAQASGTFVCNQDEGTYVMKVYSLVNGQKGNLISNLFFAVGPQSEGCQACNPAYCGGACVPGFATPSGCEPDQGYALPYCAPPTTATGAGAVSGYYNQYGQPFDPAKNSNWYYKDSNGNWFACGGSSTGLGCVELNQSVLSDWQKASSTPSGNMSNIYSDSCFIKQYYPPNQARSEIATLSGVASSSVSLGSICPGTPDYCERDLANNPNSSDADCPVGSGPKAPTSTDVNNLVAAFNYYAPISRQLTTTHPGFEYASMGYSQATMNSDGTVTFTYEGAYSTPMNWSFSTFQQISCNIITQTANVASDHSHDSVCNSLYFAGSGSTGGSSSGGGSSGSGSSGGTTQAPAPVVYVNGAPASSAVCNSTYTFQVNNYTGSSVWLEQTKNGQSRYNSATSGPYPVPITSQFVCNRDEGTYVNNVYAVAQGSSASTSGSASAGVTDIPTLVADYNQAASIINQMNQAWSAANNNAQYSMHLTMVSYNAGSSGVTIIFSDGTTRVTTLQDLQVSVQDAVTVAQGMVARPLTGTASTAASLTAAANALGTIIGQTSPGSSQTTSPSKGAFLGSVTFTVLPSGGVVTGGQAQPVSTNSPQLTQLVATWNYYAPLSRSENLSPRQNITSANLNNDGMVSYAYANSGSFVGYGLLDFQATVCSMATQIAGASGDSSHLSPPCPALNQLTPTTGGGTQSGSGSGGSTGGATSITAQSVCTFANAQNPTIPELQSCLQTLSQMLANLMKQVNH